jgi:ABC-type transporter Mla MlaB component
MLLTAGGLAAEDLAVLKTRLGAALDANTVIDAKVRIFAKEKLIPLVAHEILVQEVKAQNAKKVSLAEIQSVDKAWMAAEAEMPIQKEKLSNACAVALKEIAKSLPALREVFAMDDQGANVGQNNLTSDYWQGDEDKWKNSFAAGKGGVDVGKAKMDKSAGSVLQQVSLPLADAEGTIVGAITFGVAVDGL